jgi:hypothetical protein
MSVNELKVTVSEAQDLIKTIRLIALSGRRDFESYIYRPLDEAGWRATRNLQGARKMIERISAEARSSSYYHTVAPRCKRLILNAMGETLSILGDSCIFFLEMMQVHAVIASGPESVEFAGILEPGFSGFRRNSAEKNELRFRDALESAGAGEMQSVLEPVRLDRSSVKIKLDREITKLYNNLIIASKYNNLLKARKLIAGYIISFIDDENYSRMEVERLIEALNKRYQGFEKDLRVMIAIDLYYRISKAILAGDISGAVQGIRKYAYIFEGNPETRYFFEIDRLERILYPLISDKKLWDSLKK